MFCRYVTLPIVLPQANRVLAREIQSKTKIEELKSYRRFLNCYPDIGPYFGLCTFLS